MSALTITVSDCTCPHCGNGETHPNDTDKPIFERRLLIRGFKVCDDKGYWWSQCLVCAGYYNPATLEETPELFDRAKGWF